MACRWIHRSGCCKGGHVHRHCRRCDFASDRRKKQQRHRKSDGWTQFSVQYYKLYFGYFILLKTAGPGSGYRRNCHRGQYDGLSGRRRAYSALLCFWRFLSSDTPSIWPLTPWARSSIPAGCSILSFSESFTRTAATSLIRCVRRQNIFAL